MLAALVRCAVPGCDDPALIAHGTGCKAAWCGLHVGAPLGRCPGCGKSFVYIPRAA